MGRGAEAYNFVAIEVSLDELFRWVKDNEDIDEDYLDEFGNLDEDYEFDFVAEYAGHRTVTKTKMKMFSSINYQDCSINGLYFGTKLNSVYLNAYADGWTSVSSINYEKVIDSAEKLRELYPGKKVEIVTIQTVG